MSLMEALMMRPLESIWARLDRPVDWPAFLRINETHPLDIYVGKDMGGALQLLVLTDDEPPAPGSYKALQITKQERQDGRWALTVKLSQTELTGLFTSLCQDLVDSSTHASSRGAATRALLAQLDKWQRLMARGHNGLLEEFEIRGLFAELFYLEQFAMPFCGTTAALSGWLGPLEAPQDFRIRDRLVEIKSCGVGGAFVKISSEDQLDIVDAPLFLVVIQLADLAPGASGAVSLNDLVARIRSGLTDTGDVEIFDPRLGSAQYVARPEYSQRAYAAQAIRHFKVTDGFPRVAAARLPQGISRVKYRLAISACELFELPSSVEG